MKESESQQRMCVVKPLRPGCALGLGREELRSSETSAFTRA